MQVWYFLVFYTFIASAFAADSSPPFAMTWSTKSLGPDGPWQAVQIGIGSPSQQVALYPGGTFRSHILTPKICSNASLSPDACFAIAAGLYTVESSTTAFDTIISFPSATDFSHGGLQVEGSKGTSALDQMNIGIQTGSRNAITVPNVTIAVHDDVAAVYPNGALKALQVGTLGLGYLGTVNQSFTRTGEPMINGSLIPGYLRAQGLTPSNSFGLHIGSVKSSIKGSLFFGGYDQTRVCGNVSTQQGPFAGVEPDDDGKEGLIDLLDIAINVIDGASPFNTSKISGLLAHSNSSIGPALSLPMLPEAPYLDLPKSTCEAIASWLPVTYNSGFGLYTWNTNDARYKRIVSSPTVLTFIFRKDQTNTQNITINVPFTLLNLTLEAPLVASPTPYFPCNAQSNGRYSLGRAFLQAAFVGANWNANGNQGVWWLAQAPGPNIGQAQSTVQTIRDQDVSISASSNDWLASWKGVLVPLSATDTQPSSPSPPINNSGGDAKDPSPPKSSLSMGAKAGIGAVVAIVAIAGIALCAFLYRRRHERKQKKLKTASGSSISTRTPPEMNANTFLQEEERQSAAAGRRRDHYRNAGYGPSELSERNSVQCIGDDGGGLRGNGNGNQNHVPSMYELDGGGWKR